MDRFRGGVGGDLGGLGGGGDLPPGFRFHPTDEELISFYLVRKSLDSSFCGRAIAEIDLNKCEPWELPEKAKMGEKEWYFYSLRDRKYPTGLRTNRATVAGYWKATGKDREVRSGPAGALVGMKKTLVFYRGRAPKGMKTQWVMHEYRLEGSYAYNYHPGSTRDEWVIARVFQKPGEVPPARNKNRLVGLSSSAAEASCFSDSTSASVGGGCGGASASSAPRPLLPDASLFSAADGESGGSYGGFVGGSIAANAISNATNNLVTGRELVPCFSSNTAPMDATLGIGQYNPAPLAFEPPPANFFSSLRALQDSNIQLPLFLTSGAAASILGSGGAAHHHWSPAGMDVKIEGAGMGRAAPQQMAVGPGQLDGAYAWGF